MIGGEGGVLGVGCWVRLGVIWCCGWFCILFGLFGVVCLSWCGLVLAWTGFGVVLERGVDLEHGIGLGWCSLAESVCFCFPPPSYFR